MAVANVVSHCNCSVFVNLSAYNRESVGFYSMSLTYRFPRRVCTAFTIVSALFVILLFTGCVQHASESVVDPLAKQYFESLKNKDLDKVMDMYSEDFFQAMPKEAWRQKLEGLTQQLGDISAYSFRNKQADSRYSGKFYIYQYDTIHNDKRAKHILTFIQPVDSDEIKLVGHMIKAKGFNL